MTEQKNDTGPERGDGAARGVSVGEPKPPGEGWWKMWGDGACPPKLGQEVVIWHRDWQGVGPYQGFKEDVPQVGVWWRPVTAGPAPGAEPVPLPSWATKPMIDSGPLKHRIVQAWRVESGHLFVLGSDGRILWRDRDAAWHEIATYPPGLEP